MNRLFYWLAFFGGTILTLTMQGCEDIDNGGTTGTSCSCQEPSYGEGRVATLDFENPDIIEGLKFIGYYGDEGVGGDCYCSSYGYEAEVTGFANHLNVETVNSRKHAIYSTDTSTDTSIIFRSLFLPNQWTLQLWLNSSTSVSSGVIMEENIRNKRALFLSLTNDKKLSISLPLSGYSVSSTHLSIESSSTLTTNTWQHIAVSVSGNNVAFYINGVLDKQQNFDNSVYNTLAARSSFSAGEKRLCFGSCQSISISDKSFQGKVDDIEFVNRVLSTAEILSNYQSSQSNFP